MSKNLTHGRSPEQRTANHEKRLLAIERKLATLDAIEGIPALRDALYAAAGVVRNERCRNFDPAFATTSFAISSGSRRYNAVYWPGGPCTGMTTIITQVGNYTDATPNSGAALYTTDGTTLTQAAANARKWTLALGEQEVPWAGGPFTLDPQILYVAVEYFQTAVVTVPQWAGNNVIDATIWGGDTNNDLTPAGWPIMFQQTGAASPLPASVAISSLTVGASVNVHYCGLY